MDPSLVHVSAISTMILLVFLLIFVVHAESTRCSIYLKELSEAAPPLFVRSDHVLQGASSLLQASEGGIVNLATNTSLKLACPGVRNQLLFNGHPVNIQMINATCLSDRVIHIHGVGAVSVSALSCAEPAERVVEGNRRERCGAGSRGLRMRMGFRLPHGFLELVSTCFDDRLVSPIYANYTLTQENAMSWPRGGPAHFSVASSEIGNVNLDLQYKQQTNTLQTLLGSVVLNDSLIPGFLSPRFSTGFQPQENVTLFFVNSAPQWASVNAGAWAGVERSVRDLAAARGDLQVVTGTHDVATLPDAQGRQTQLFLYADAAQRKMPVPALFWKVVYDPRTKEGAAIIVNNNPTRSLSSSIGFTHETDMCDQLRWLRLAPSISRDLFCCEVKTLRQKITDTPPLDVRALLVASGKEFDSSKTESMSTTSTISTPTSEYNNEITREAKNVNITREKAGVPSNSSVKNKGISTVVENIYFIFALISFKFIPNL